MRHGWTALGLVWALAGCARPEAPAPQQTSILPAADEFKGWPKDTIERPDMNGTVERATTKLDDDPEADRIPCFYSVPDWADPDGPLAYKGPEGCRLEFHLLKGTMDQDDQAKFSSLASGKSKDAAVLYVARPWRGWYGEAAVGEGKSERRVRIYTLFSKDYSLEVHMEWPLAKPKAHIEGEALANTLICSMQPAP